ncbi:MAG: hypothetical protein QG675_63 [Patescibacteria group bacterium]|nr:hypothetical protein [Patescibacteria group bacterium]
MDTARSDRGRSYKQSQGVGAARDGELVVRRLQYQLQQP